MTDIDFGKKQKIFLAGILLLLCILFGMCAIFLLQNRQLREEIRELSTALAQKDQALEASDRERERFRDMLHMQERMAQSTSLEEYSTQTGFTKKGGIYLIDSAYQMETLRQMVIRGEEIEPGLPAAEASYRLRASLKLGDWFSIGTEEMPFRGIFDGDGNSIGGRFPLMDGRDVPEAVFRTDSGARIANLRVENRMTDSRDTEIRFVVKDPGECAELETYLEDFPDCRVGVELYAGVPDIRAAADALRECWERNQDREGYYVSLSFYPIFGEEPDREAYERNVLAPMCALAGEEYGEIIREVLDLEGGHLRFVRLEQTGGIICCTFETGEAKLEYPQEGQGYHLILEGQWEGTDVQRQHLFIPYTDHEQYCLGENQAYRVEKVDLDFDGKQDLLIHEGASGGSGGSWENYRAAVWKEENGQFAYFPSFPEQLLALEFDNQRVITRGRVGAGYEYVMVYGVVNGEYVCTRELVCQTVYRGEEQVEELSYYEMGELVQTHILSDSEEAGRLYPDMDYWFRG